MANVSRRNGLKPVKHLDGSPFNGQVNRYFAAATDATAIFNGDLVTLAAVIDTQGQALLGGFNATVGGTQGVTKATLGAGNPAVGVAVGFMVNPVNLNSPQYRVASTAMYVLVADSPDTVFEIQSEVAPTPTDLNSNAVITDGGGSTTTGISGQYVSSYNTGATNQLKVLGAVQKVDNDITAANYKILVTINNHQYAAGTGTLGV